MASGETSCSARNRILLFDDDDDDDCNDSCGGYLSKKEDEVDVVVEFVSGVDVAVVIVAVVFV